ncbi:DUF3489 domain-containing protein [Xanthobacter sp. V3C-3]|uniref:DUF3489 domain-containing protein n=1 Tax=Xanthobacter lutulentifluminis TaxID=3119935 RepID=UPI00372C756F
MTRRNTRPALAQPKIEPKATVAVARKTKTKTKAATTSRTAPEPALTLPPSTITLKAPSGKLATLLDRIGQLSGATIDELSGATGWQAHTIRAAFSRLRQRGFPITLVTDADGRKAYRVDSQEG